jgi:hypothetical protein
LDRLRAHLPGAVELVYDNYNALVIGFGPSEKPSDAVLSLVLYPRQVNVCFLWGAELFDPEHVLRGRGARARTIAVDDPQRLDESAIRLLIDQAATRVPWTDRSKDARRIVMRSISARQRPRRPM